MMSMPQDYSRTIARALLPTSLESVGRLIVTLMAAALMTVGTVTVLPNWHLTDLKAYLAAAESLATGANPFEVQIWERGLPYHYHYSPWFAALFVPLTALPVEAVRVGWSVVLIAASSAALVPLMRTHGWKATPLALLMAFLLLNLIAEGNVQPLLLAGLVWTLERRAGPVMIGVAASLKLVPIVFALVYIGRGEWRRATVAAAVAAVLLAPTFLFELSPTALETGGTGLYSTAPVIWALSALLAVAATLALARGRFGWLAAATATILALPRLLVFDVTNLLAAPPHSPRDAR